MNKLETKLKKDLNDACAYIQAKEEDQDWRYDENHREDTEYDLKVSQNIKDYLEGVLGITYIWLEDEQAFVERKAD
tara:strand:+ start:83 stop:310 length:228 start_codon:yes stop_codon:yes gene_type:complete